MPNWAEGVLKIRGTRANIKRFLTEGLSPINSFASIQQALGKPVTVPEVEVKEDKWDFQMSTKEGFYIKGTRRAFFERPIVWDFQDRTLEILTIDSFKQAWGVEVSKFAELSKEYGVDFKIYVFERGMEFNQDIEVVEGEVIKDEEIQFADYEWECLFPALGG